jgi:ribosomal protein S4E
MTASRFFRKTVRDLKKKQPEQRMKTKPASKLVDGVHCTVVGGTHAGKSGTARDIKTGKTGHVSITVVQKSGAKNVVVST